MSGRQGRRHRIAVSGQLQELRQEVLIPGFRRAELVRPAVHVWRALPVAVRRGIGQRPLHAVVVPGILRRLFAKFQAPQEVEGKQDLHGEQRKGGVGDEHVQRLLRLQEVVDRGIVDATIYDFLKPQQPLNVFISYSAFALFAVQILFAFNFLWSLKFGKKAPQNPWDDNGMEWSLPNPAPHGNWERTPNVYRGPYELSAPE